MWPIETDLFCRGPDCSFTDTRDQGRFPRLSEGVTTDGVGVFRPREKGRGSSVPVECVQGRIA